MAVASSVDELIRSETKDELIIAIFQVFLWPEYCPMVTSQIFTLNCNGFSEDVMDFLKEDYTSMYGCLILTILSGLNAGTNVQ